jgi:phage shock protein PspC (stress-responsive transcriptional regulator)
MKKTLQIHIAKTLFTIEEDAYAALETYLSSVRAHFDATDAKDEIITDIEARIAEQLLESKESVITLPTVERVTAQMGSVTDFDDEENARGTNMSLRKRLYRDTDTGLLAGVSSGLAAYFGLNVVLVRLFFLVLTLGNGFGILVYAILWLTVPEAKTASQRLEMSGEPVNLATIRGFAAERMRDTSARRIGMLIARVTALLVTLFRFAIGAGLVFFSAGTAIAVLIAGGFFLSNTAWLTVDVPMSVLRPGWEYWIVLLAATVAALIPLFFTLLAGLALLMKRISLAGRVALILLGIWLVTLIVCGFGLAETITNYQEY